MRDLPRRLISRLLSLCALLAVAAPASAFQTFGPDRRIDPSYRSFRYFISSTYYDFVADGQQPITAIHVDGVAKSLAILAEKAGVEGLTFTYAGTFEHAELGERNRVVGVHEDYHQTLYFDFTSNDLWGRAGMPTATADHKKSPASGAFVSGGVIRMNSDFLNFLHPDVNMASIVIHETLHIFGLDHSTISSAVMAYTEFWYPTLSADDVLGLRQIFGVGPQTSLTVDVTLAGVPAPGVEVAVIDPTTGQAAAVVADAAGRAVVRHLEPKAYVVGVRELTPTGPCFSNPTRGFLTTFAAADGGVTNDPGAARLVELAAGVPTSVTVPLIPGVKKFDCHFGRATALSDEACNANSFGSPTFEESCYLHMTRAGVRFPLLVETDLSLFHHKTVTDVNSGAHARLAIQDFGGARDLTFHTAVVDPEFNNHLRVDMTIGANAAPGVHAAVCSADGEFALLTSYLEVQDFGGSLNNTRLLPHLKDEMERHRTARNFGQEARPGETGTGPRLPNGVGNLGGGASDDDGDKKKKKKGPLGCGVAGDREASGVGAFLLIAALGIALIPAVTRRTCSRVGHRLAAGR